MVSVCMMAMVAGGTYWADMGTEGTIATTHPYTLHTLHGGRRQGTALLLVGISLTRNEGPVDLLWMLKGIRSHFSKDLSGSVPSYHANQEPPGHQSILSKGTMTSTLKLKLFLAL